MCIRDSHTMSPRISTPLGSAARHYSSTLNWMRKALDGLPQGVKRTFNVHSEGRAPLLRASLSTVRLERNGLRHGKCILHPVDQSGPAIRNITVALVERFGRQSAGEKH